MRRHLKTASVATLGSVGAAILFIHAGARQIDWNTVCVGYARKLAVGVAMYAQDWDATLPPGMGGADFRRELFPYVKPWLFFCPVTKLPYTPNSDLSGRKLRDFEDFGTVPVVKDTRPHNSGGAYTVAFLDSHVERGGVDAEDPNVECVRNARNLVIATVMYAQDYDGTLPPMGSGAQWEAAIYDYAGHSRSVFSCPATYLPYAPNTALGGTLLSAYFQPAAVPVLRDPLPHRDGKSTTGYLDGHVERR
jgi:prepilin-type processing-associated H-X9-DG protein